MTLIPTGHTTCEEAGICSGWVQHLIRLLVLGQVLHCQNTPPQWLVCQLGDKGDSTLGNSPGLRAINRSQWEQQRHLVGWGGGQKASLGAA